MSLQFGTKSIISQVTLLKVQFSVHDTTKGRLSVHETCQVISHEDEKNNLRELVVRRNPWQKFKLAKLKSDHLQLY